MCSSCRNISLSTTIKKDRKEKFIEELESKISKKELMQLVREKSFDEIGRIYGVAGNTIKKWCKHYCIPFRREDIKEIKKEDWNEECSLSKEEYEKKYINTKKEKPIITDQEIVDKYLEVKNITYLEKFFHRDKDTIKKILINNGIDLSDILKKNIIKVQQLDCNSLEVLKEFSSSNEAILYILDNKLSNTLDKGVIRKAIYKSNSKGRVSYGYLWKFIYEE